MLALILRKCWPPLLNVVHIGVVLLGVALISLKVIHFDIVVSVARPPIVIVTVAEGAWFLDIDLFEIGIPLDIVDVTWILIPSKFHCEKWAPIW